MFERFLKFSKSPEQQERAICKILERRLSQGVNGPAIYCAFQEAQAENKTKNFGLTNNHILNLTRDMAFVLSGTIEDTMYGGAEETINNINAEIEKIRQELSDEERGN